MLIWRFFFLIFVGRPNSFFKMEFKVWLKSNQIEQSYLIHSKNCFQKLVNQVFNARSDDFDF